MTPYEQFASEYKKLKPAATNQEIDAGYGLHFGVGDAMESGLMAGGYNLAGSLASFTEMLGLPTGKFADSMRGEAAKWPLPKELQGSLVDDPSKILDPKRLSYDVAGILPSLAATIGTGGAAKVAGLGPKAAALTGAGVGGAMEAGGMYNETGDTMDSALFGLGVTGLSFLPTHMALQTMAGKYGKMPLGATLLQGFAEGGEEFLEEPLGALITGEDMGTALKRGVDVLPASILSGMLPGGGQMLKSQAEKILSPGRSQQQAMPYNGPVPEEASPTIYNRKDAAPAITVPDASEDLPNVAVGRVEREMQNMFSANPEPAEADLSKIFGAPKPRKGKPSLDANVKPRPYAELKRNMEWAINNDKDGDWYSQFGRGIQSVVGPANMQEASILFGITSSQNSAENNLADTLHVMSVARQVDPVTNPDGFREALRAPTRPNGQKAKITGGQIDKIIEMYNKGTVEGGLKVTSYMQAIKNGAGNLFNPRTVQDVHMAREFGFLYRDVKKSKTKSNIVDAAKFPSSSAIRYGQYMTMKLAEEYGVTPEKAQALLWFHAKNNLSPKVGQKSHKKWDGTWASAQSYAAPEIERAAATVNRDKPINDKFINPAAPDFTSPVISDPYSNTAFNAQLEERAMQRAPRAVVSANPGNARGFGFPEGTPLSVLQSYNRDMLKSISDNEGQIKVLRELAIPHVVKDVLGTFDRMEPSFEIILPSSTPAEAKMVASLLGDALLQDAAITSKPDFHGQGFGILVAKPDGTVWAQEEIEKVYDKVNPGHSTSGLNLPTTADGTGLKFLDNAFFEKDGYGDDDFDQFITTLKEAIGDGYKLGKFSQEGDYIDQSGYAEGVAEARDRGTRIGSPDIQGAFDRGLYQPVRETYERYQQQLGVTKPYKMVAFHGTGKSEPFDRFSTDHIGSGEGAQAYGHGLYFTSKERIAEWYRDQLSSAYENYSYHGEGLADSNLSPTEIYALDSYGHQRFVLGNSHKTSVKHVLESGVETTIKTQERDLYFFEQELKRVKETGKTSEQFRNNNRNMMPAEIVPWLESNIDTVNYKLQGMREARTFMKKLKDGEVTAYKGKVYEVDLAPSEDEYLLWDEPLSGQSDKVKAALETIGVKLAKVADGEFNMSDISGADIYTILSMRNDTPAEASKQLLDAGIRGNKYLDGSSRKKGEGHYNYVIFDDKDVIIKSYKMTFEKKLNIERFNGLAKAILGLGPTSNKVTSGRKNSGFKVEHSPLNKMLEGMGSARKYAITTGEDAQGVAGVYKAEVIDALWDAIDGLPDSVHDAFDAIVMTTDKDAGAAAYVPKSTNMGVETPASLMFDGNFLQAIIDSNDDNLRIALRDILSHELSHAIDIDKNRNMSATWDSPLFHVEPLMVKLVPDPNAPMGARIVHGKNNVGPVMAEAMRIMNNKAATKDGLSRFLTYPMSDIGHIAIAGGTIMDMESNVEYKIDGNLKKTRPDIASYLEGQVKQEQKRIQAELFAQLQALYTTHNALLKKHMPVAYKMMEEVNNGIQQAGGINDIYRAVRAGLRSQSPAGVDYNQVYSSRSATGEGAEGGFGERDPNTRVFNGETGNRGDPFEQAANSTGPEVQDNFAGVQERVRDVGGEKTAFERKRGVITNEQAQMIADMMGVPWNLMSQQLGDTYNVEDLISAAKDINKTWTEGRANLASILEKHQAGTLTANEMNDAQETMLKMSALGAQFFGVRGEAGRALQIFRKIKSSTEKARYMIDVVKGIRNEQDLIDAMNNIVKIEEPGTAARATTDLMKVTTMDQFLEWYYASLLSGPPTHAVNIVSTGLQGIMGEIDNVVASAVGGIFGSEDRITAAEISARMGAVVKGAHMGFKESARAFREYENADFEEFGPVKESRQLKRAIPTVAGKAIRLPMRMLSVEDTFWKVMFYNMGIAQEAQRVHNLNPEQTVEELTKNPTDEMKKTAWKQARQATFTEEGGAITKSIQKFRKEHPVISLILPFVQTPGNIIKTVVRHSPAAPILREVRDDIRKGGRVRDLAVARILVGSSLMAVSYALASAGVITGQPPEDKDERLAFYMEGKQPYSIKMGDKWVSFSRLEPFGMLVGGAADLFSIRQNLSADEGEEIAAVLMASVAKNLTSKTYLRGVSDFVNMMTEPERYSERYLQRFASTVLVPTGLAYTAKAMDDRRREIHSLGDSIKSRLPGLRSTLTEKLDIRGDPMMEEGSGMYRMISPAYLSKITDDRVAREMAKYDVSFPVIGKKYRGVELEPETRNELVKAVGKPTYSIVEKLVKSRTYQSLSDPMRKYLLQKLINKMRSSAKLGWAKKHPEILREALILSRQKKYGEGL